MCNIFILIISIFVKSFKIMHNDFIIISGPCGVESEEQVFETAKKLKESVQPDYFRAGLWKPRTRPGSFEGIGERGIPWLLRVKNELGLSIITEVGCSKHVESVLANGIKAYWIGARTVSNPFSIQEIIEATYDNDIDVFIKNPIFPDIELWTGVIERYLNAGFKNIYAVHRGFYPYKETHLRNIPIWEIPIELVRRFPEIKMICDPSHIAGSTKYIQEISQHAINLNMDGLMIESHINPECALSDKKQQLTPDALEEILSKLIFKSRNTNDLDYEQKLFKIRNEIDIIDNELVDILKLRFDLTDKIGELKKEYNITTLQLERWKNIVETRLKYAGSYGITKDFVLKLFELIHEESINRQNNIINN